MPDAIVNQPYVFQVLFVAEGNVPIAVVGPTITVFTFSDAGVKQVLVQSAPMIPVTPAETGRYTYVYVIPGSFGQGDVIYAEMEAVDPADPAARYLSEDLVNVTTLGGSGSSSGMTARFVKGG